jgi:hypothetical protein
VRKTVKFEEAHDGFKRYFGFFSTGPCNHKNLWQGKSLKKNDNTLFAFYLFG